MSQPPLWDGSGIDPWLPERLAAMAEIARAERRVYDSWWGSFSDWLVKVHRSVMANGQPDPHGVFAHAPAWAAEMTAFTRGPVRDAVGIAFEQLFGPDYIFDSRPAVTTYLAEVQNRMVRTPDDVFSVVSSEVARGAAAGDSIPTVAARIDKLLDSTAAVENWSGRAVTVARTETIGALNFGRMDSFGVLAESIGGDFEQQWLATLDARVRTEPDGGHRAADGQRVPLGEPFDVGGESLNYPGDPAGSPGNVINCVVAGTVVEFPALRAVMRRWFEGDVIELRFATGDQLTVTPNHPVLRADGRWTAAGELREGDHCVRCAGLDGALGAPDEDGGPTEVSQIYSAANQSRDAERVAVAPPDFHGDGLHGHVDVVSVNRPLNVDALAATDEQVVQLGLALADEARSRVGAPYGLAMAAKRPAPDRCGDVAPAASGVRGCGESLALRGVESAHAQPVGLAPAPRFDTECTQPPDDGRSADTQRAGHGKNTFATLEPCAEFGWIDLHALRNDVGLPERAHAGTGQAKVAVDGHWGDAETPRQHRRRLPAFVATTQIAQVKRYAFAGHVFNLDTGEGWYIANGIATRNCRCTVLLVAAGETVDMTGRGFTDTDAYWNDFGYDEQP